MIGLSTSYYAMKGLSIYESVLKTVDLGFELIELGAAHEYEDNPFDTMREIKRDFPSVSFTVHTLFPPLQKRVWFNPADGLNEINKKIVDGLFETASIVDASLISIHPPVFNDIKLGGTNLAKFHRPVPGKAKNKNTGKERFFQLLKYISRQSDDCGIKIIIENISFSSSCSINSYPYTREDFVELFEKFPGVGFLLDVGHALRNDNLYDLVKMYGKIFELHLHDIGYNSDNKLSAHLPIKNSEFFAPIKEIVNKSSMAIIFEHGIDVTEEEILTEKALLEAVIAN
jgi:sugar phosphate isomerase/epimerase